MTKDSDLERLLREQEVWLDAFCPTGQRPMCGARTRDGTPCESRVLRRAGRCKCHGGCSTGPRTAAGKAASSLNGSRYWLARRAAGNR